MSSCSLCDLPADPPVTSDDADVSRIFEKPIGKQRLLDLIRQLV